MRALARLQGEVRDEMILSELIGKGVLVITITPNEGERYQGVISLDKPTITECLEDYFVRSEQLQTQLIIRTGEFNGEPVAAGMLLQVMPDGVGEEGDFEHLATLTATVKDEEIFGLTAEEMLYRLYHEETVEIYPAQQVSFFCGCSQSVRAGHYCSCQRQKLTKFSLNTTAALICNANVVERIISLIKKRLKNCEM